MAFTIITEVQEKLTELCEEYNTQRLDKIEQIIEEIEQAREKKLVGTPVTLETFTVWKIKFQAEMKVLYDQKCSQWEKDQEGKLTGKFLFQEKKAKAEVDDDEDFDVADLVDNSDAKIEVDEALFED